MKKVLAIIGGVVTFIGLIIFGYFMLFVDGKVQSKYNNTVGIEVKDSQRNMYEHSTTYVEGKVQELAKEKRELVDIKDVPTRKAIIEMLISDCANLDINDINDLSIRTFLQQIRNGEIK